MTKRSRHLMLLGVAVLPVAAFSFGGWAVVTVDDLPDSIVAGKPVSLSFAVRQHGRTLLPNLSPQVTAKAKGSEVQVAATPGGNDRYKAVLTIPHAGNWTIAIQSGFMNAGVTLVPIRVVQPDASPLPALTEVERGMRLFVAKGCVTCHTLEETSAWSTIAVGPTLTGRRYVPEVLTTFLADPERSPLARNTQSEIRMPNLGLKEREIAALVAFINSTGQGASRSTRR
jgi:mono/diheme cytochrome c family protein